MYQDKYDLDRGDFSKGIYDVSKAESASKSAARAAAPASTMRRMPSSIVSGE